MTEEHDVGCEVTERERTTYGMVMDNEADAEVLCRWILGRIRQCDD